MNKKILLIIGAGKHQVSLIKKSKEMGFYTLVVDIDPNAEGFQYCDKPLIQSAYNHSLILKTLESLGVLGDICGVITQAARDCVVTVSKVSEHLGLRHLSVKCAELSLQKGKLSRLLNPNMLISVFDDQSKLPEKINYPCVLKWEGTSGGSGVNLINDCNEYAELIPKVPKNTKLILEKFIKGRHFGVIGVLNGKNKKIYTIVEKIQNPNLTLDRVICPAQIDKNTSKKLKLYVDNLIDKLNINFGPIQIELIIDPQGEIFFIEFEPSVLGSYLSELLIPGVSSNDMIGDSINLICKGEFDDYVKPIVFKSILKYYYPKDLGVVKNIAPCQANYKALFKPYFNTGDQIVERKMYIANAFFIGQNFDKLKGAIDKYKIEMEVQ